MTGGHGGCARGARHCPTPCAPGPPSSEGRLGPCVWAAQSGRDTWELKTGSLGVLRSGVTSLPGRRLSSDGGLWGRAEGPHLFRVSFHFTHW